MGIVYTVLYCVYRNGFLPQNMANLHLKCIESLPINNQTTYNYIQQLFKATLSPFFSIYLFLASAII